VQKLESAAHMQVDFRRLGTIALLEEAASPSEYKKISVSDLQRLEPSTNSNGLQTFFVQEDSVDPYLLMKAAVGAAQNQGIEIRGHATVKEIREHGSKVQVSVEAGQLTANSYVNCQGAWSGAPVKPRKGQMLYVQPSAKILQHVLRTPEVYIVPRSSDKILIGATVEDVGFDKSVSTSTIHNMLGSAAKYLPELAPATITQSWAGLRPGTPDDLPIIGATDIPNSFIASGHFRNGILLAPVTARIVADLIEGKPSFLDISQFSPARFGSGTVRKLCH
jgi:glycine oxidase